MSPIIHPPRELKPLSRKLSPLWLVLAAWLAGCGSGTSLPDCDSVRQVVVTDIDETLTTSDAEFVQQLVDPEHDPAMRAGGPELMQGYAERGFVIHYLTARSKTLELTDGTTCEQATIGWLEQHGFPWNQDQTWLDLADAVLGSDDTVTYKSAAIETRKSEGYSYEYAYGNATTDIDAYEAAGIDKTETFIIGTHAGEQGTRAIDGEDFVQHAAEQLPQVPAVCAFH